MIIKKKARPDSDADGAAAADDGDDELNSVNSAAVGGAISAGQTWSVRRLETVVTSSAYA